MDRMSTRFDENDQWLAVERGPWTIVCNLGKAPMTMQLREGVHQLLAASEVGITVTPTAVTLPPDSVAILRLPE